MLAEAAAAYPTAGLRTVYGAELSLGLSGPQNGVPDPEGHHLLVLARGVEGYHRLAAAMTDAHLRGDEKGRPVYDLAELAERGRGPLGGADRLPQGAGALGPRHRRSGRGERGARPADPPVRDRPRGGRALAQPAPGHRRDQHPAGRAGRRPRPARRGRRQRPPRHAGVGAAGLGDGRRTRAAQPRRHGRLARPVRRRPPAQRRRGRRRAAPLARRRPAQRRARRRARLRPAQGLAAAAQAPHPRGPHRRLVAAGAGVARLRGAVRRTAARRGGPRADRARAAGGGGEGLLRLLRHRPRHRRLRPQPGDPLPGPGLGGQLGDLLRARHHRGRRGLLPAALRAVHLRAPRRGARHRRRLRLRPPRGGHPVGLRHLRPPQRGAGGQRDHLPAADGGPRRGQGAGPLPGAAGRVVQADRRLARRRHRRPGRRRRRTTYPPPWSPWPSS